MQKKPLELYFIDRVNFTQLQSKDVSLTDIRSLFTHHYNPSYQTQENRNKFSTLTKAFILQLNLLMNRALFSYNSSNDYTDFSSPLSKNDITYVEHSAKSFLSKVTHAGYDEDCLESCTDTKIYPPKKYYEIIPQSDATGSQLLVVLEEGFFANLTKCKEELLKFLLDSLSYQYKWNAYLERLLRLYLSVKVNEGQFDLVKLRFEAPR